MLCGNVRVMILAQSSDPTWVTFAAALLGAAVGGIASAFGSAVVSRRALARETRIRIYDELLPGFPNWQHDTFEARLDELNRAAVIAGRRDRRKAAEIHLAYLLVKESNTGEAHRDDWWNDVERYLDAVAEYKQWLERQIA